MIVLNDIQSQLNATEVSEVIRPASAQEAAEVIRRSVAKKQQISIAGGRHSMGGQQFGTGTTSIDTRDLSGVIGLNVEDSTVEVQAGITWPSLVSWLKNNQDENEGSLTIIQKQTGADDMTIGGALSSNVHGRGLNYQPIVQDVDSFTLLDPSGATMVCSRDQNHEVFRLGIGGYGLFGLIHTVTLRLHPRHKLMREVKVVEVDDVMPSFEQRIYEGHLYGDFQYMTDEKSDGFLRKGILSCYRPVGFSTPIPENQLGLTVDDWMNLYYLAHVDKKEAYDRYVHHYLQSNEQIYWSDDFQFSPYLSNAGELLHQRLGAKEFASLMITELYVPRSKFVDFMESVRRDLLDLSADVIYGTVRLIKKENETFLTWAKGDFACIILNLRVVHTDQGISRAKEQFQMLIDHALSYDGLYYLTYHRWARKDQLLSAYPQMPEFLKQKRQFDPEETFQNEWYRYYKGIL